MHPGAFSDQETWIENPQEDPWQCTVSVCSGNELFGDLVGVSRSIERDFHHSLLAPTALTAFSNYTEPNLFCSTVFISSYLSSLFIFGSCGRLKWRNRQLSSASYHHYHLFLSVLSIYLRILLSVVFYRLLLWISYCV